MFNHPLLKPLIMPIVHHLYRPLVMKYLSVKRFYRYRGISLVVNPGVFHPGFYFSTRLLLEFLEKVDLNGKRILELGAGSGLISISAAKRGARVTASDINRTAVKTVQQNARLNNVQLTAIESDLFQNIPHQTFDCIIINPPYYPRDPSKESDHAWFCGAEYEYFEALFSQLGPYFRFDSKIYMILAEVCQIDRIEEIAETHHFRMNEVFQKRVYWELNSIFEIRHGE